MSWEPESNFTLNITKKERQTHIGLSCLGFLVVYAGGVCVCSFFVYILSCKSTNRTGVLTGVWSDVAAVLSSPITLKIPNET